jgi:hypothetical protein
MERLTTNYIYKVDGVRRGVGGPFISTRKKELKILFSQDLLASQGQWYGALAKCGPLAEDSAAKLKRG